MKAMTTKRCKSLPEVLAAQNRQLEERRRRCNRLMRDVFNKVRLSPYFISICYLINNNNSKSHQRLQSRVANGQLSLNHSRTII